jgi:subtilisin family serine protease
MALTTGRNFLVAYFLCCALTWSFTGIADLIITVKEPYRNQETFASLQKEYSIHAKFGEFVHGVMPVRISPGVSRDITVTLLESDQRVAFVEPDFLVQAQELPDDPLFDRQWALYNPGRDRVDIRAPEAWEIQTGSGKIILAVIDTGIDYLHPDLAKNMWKNSKELPRNGIDDDRNGFTDDVYGWDFAYDDNDPMDRHFHGTLVAGIAGAVTGNSRGIAGTMHEVSLMAVKGLSDRGFGYTSDLVAAIYYAVDNGARVINASWGGGGFLRAMEEALAYAARHNVIFVAAAGNYRRNNDETPFYPASYEGDNIVSVGASDQRDSIAGFSHYGKKSVDLFAPGVHILSTALNGHYVYQSGTSLAAPYVAGCLGLLVSGSPEVPYKAYIKVLVESVIPRPWMKDRCVSGGRLDAHSMLLQRRSMFKTVEASRSLRSVLYVLTRILEEKQWLSQ